MSMYVGLAHLLKRRNSMYVVNNVARRTLTTAGIVFMWLITLGQTGDYVAVEQRYEDPSSHSKKEFASHLLFAVKLRLQLWPPISRRGLASADTPPTKDK